VNRLSDFLRHLREWLCAVLGLGCTNANRGDFRARLWFVSDANHNPIFLETYMSASLTLSLDDTGAHSAVLTCTNTQDGSPAQNVTISYAGDNDAVATVAPDTGALRLVSVGTCNITGTGVRGAFTHSDTGVLTVTPGDPNAQDFTATLGLS
jgi:hypothetical protein